MRFSPLRFYFADSFFFMFYSLGPNLGHFGPKPVGLLPRASVQFTALVHPVQPTHSVLGSQDFFLYYMDVLQPYISMATMFPCADL